MIDLNTARILHRNPAYYKRLIRDALIKIGKNRKFVYKNNETHKLNNIWKTSMRKTTIIIYPAVIKTIIDQCISRLN